MDFYEDDKKKKKKEYIQVNEPVDISKADFSKPSEPEAKQNGDVLDLSKIDFSKPVANTPKSRTGKLVKVPVQQPQIAPAPQQEGPSPLDQFKEMYGEPVEGLIGKSKVQRLQENNLNPNAVQPEGDKQGIKTFGGAALMDSNRFKGLQGSDARIAAQKTYAGFLGFNDEEQDNIVELAKKVEGDDKALWFDFNKNQPVENVDQLIQEGDYLPSGDIKFINYNDKEARTYALGLISRLAKSENGGVFDTDKAKEYWDNYKKVSIEEDKRQEEYKASRQGVIAGTEEYPFLSGVWDAIESTFAPLGRNEVPAIVKKYAETILGHSTSSLPPNTQGDMAGDQYDFQNSSSIEPVKQLLALRNYQQSTKYGEMFSQLAKNPDTRWIFAVSPLVYFTYLKTTTPEQRKDIDKYIPSTLRMEQTAANMAPMALGNGSVPMFLAMIDSQTKDSSPDDYNSAMLTGALTMGVGHVAGMAKPLIGSIASNAVQTGAFGAMVGQHYVHNWDKYHNPDGTINSQELLPDLLVDAAMSGLTFGGIKEAKDSIKSKINPRPFQVVNMVMQAEGKYAMFVMNPDSKILEPKFISKEEVDTWKKTQDEAGRQYIIQNVSPEQMGGFVRNGSEGMKEAFNYLLTGEKGEVRNLSDSVIKSKRYDVKSDAGKAILNEDNKLDPIKSNIHVGRDINRLDENREYQALQLLVDYQAPLNVNINLVGGNEATLNTIKSLESKNLIKIDEKGQITPTNTARVALERFKTTVESFGTALDEARGKYGEGKEIDSGAITKDTEGNELVSVSVKDKLYTPDDLISMGERKKQALVLSVLKGDAVFDKEAGTIKGKDYVGPVTEADDVKITDVKEDDVSSSVREPSIPKDKVDIKAGDFTFRNLEEDEIFNPKDEIIVKDENSGRIMTLERNKKGLYGDNRPNSSINNLSKKTIEQRIREGDYTFGVPKEAKVDVGGLEKPPESIRSLTWEERPPSNTPEFKGTKYEELTEEEKTSMENLFLPENSQQKLPVNRQFKATERSMPDLFELGRAIKTQDHEGTVNLLKKILGAEYETNPERVGKLYSKALEAVEHPQTQRARVIEENRPKLTDEERKQNEVNTISRKGEVKVSPSLSIKAEDPKWWSFSEPDFVQDSKNPNLFILNRSLTDWLVPTENGIAGFATTKAGALEHIGNFVRGKYYGENDILPKLVKAIEANNENGITFVKFDPKNIDYPTFEETLAHEKTHALMFNEIGEILPKEVYSEPLSMPHADIVSKAINKQETLPLEGSRLAHEVIAYGTTVGDLSMIDINTPEELEAYFKTYNDLLNSLQNHYGDDVIKKIEELANPKLTEVRKALNEYDEANRLRDTQKRLETDRRAEEDRILQKTWEGSGVKEIKAERFTPTGKFEDYTNYPAAETKNRLGGKKTFNFFVGKPDGTFVVEGAFKNTNLKVFQFEGKMNLLDIGKDLKATSDYNNLDFDEFQKLYEEQGYHGFFSSRNDLPDAYRYRMAVFDNDETRAILSGDYGPLAMRQREHFLNDPNFIRWFKDSAVTDWEGNPRIVYHGTFKDFEVFNTISFVSLGAHFGTIKQSDYFAKDSYTDTVGQVLPVYLKIKNPLRLKDRGQWTPNELIPQLVDKKITTEQELIDRKIISSTDINKHRFGDKTYPYRFTSRESLDNFKFLLQDKGYDGVVYTNAYENRESGMDSYIVFHPYQVKSAIVNKGLFSEWDSSIVHSRMRTSDNSPITEASKAGFYSPVEEAILQADESGKLPDKASGKDWLNKITALTYDDNGVRRGVKQDELGWMGFGVILAFPKDRSFTKQEILDFIKTNKVVVEEKQYGGNSNSIISEDFKAKLEDVNARYVKVQDISDQKKNQIVEKYKEKGGIGNYNDAIIEWSRTLEYLNLEKIKKERNIILVEKFHHMEQNSPQWASGNLILGGERSNDVELALSIPVLQKGNTKGTRAMPSSSDIYSSPHDFPDNTIVHIRGNERKLVSGEDVFHIEEIQSDLHQTGKKEGYYTGTSLEETYDPLIGEYTSDDLSRVPDAPFKDTGWIELGFRKALRYAVENGFSKLTWTTGKQQIDRNEYDLIRNVKSIEYSNKLKDFPHLQVSKEDSTESDFKVNIKVIDTKGVQHNYSVPYEGRTLITGYITSLDNILGKKMADEVRANKEGKFEGDNLSIGGGLHKFVYDEFLPRYAAKFGKKWGAEISKEKLKTKNLNFEKLEDHNGRFGVYDENNDTDYTRSDFKTEQEAQDYIDNYKGEDLHSMTIPDSMKESVSLGLPLFSRSRIKNSPEVREDKLMREYYSGPPKVEGITNIVKQGFFSNLSAVKEGMSPEESIKAMDSLKKDLEKNNLKIINSKGVYKGQPEDSYLVYYPDSESSRTVQLLSNKYEQESALHGAGGKYWLEFEDGSKVQVDSSNLTLDKMQTGEKGYSLQQGYAQEKSFNVSPEKRPYLQVPSEDLMNEIADARTSDLHTPEDPATKKAYNTFFKETNDQYDYISKSGIKVESWDKEGEPYKNSKEMMNDVESGHFYYLPTNKAFGDKLLESEIAPNKETHLTLKDSGKKDSNGKEMPYNDVFRVVHDLMGHSGNKWQFGVRGEWNAFASHAELYSPEAFPALAAESFTQNAVIAKKNYTREGNKYTLAVKPEEIEYADQKSSIPSPEIIDKIKAALNTSHNEAKNFKEDGTYIELPDGTIKYNVNFDKGENISAPPNYNLDLAKLKLKEKVNGIPDNRKVQNIEALKTEDGMVTKYDVVDKDNKLVATSKVDDKGQEYFELDGKRHDLMEDKSGSYKKADFDTIGVPTHELLSKLDINEEENKPLVDSLVELEKQQADFSDIYAQITRKESQDSNWNKSDTRYGLDLDKKGALLMRAKTGKAKKTVDIDVSEPLLAAGDFDAWIDIATRYIQNGNLTNGEVNKIAQLCAKKDIDSLHKFVVGLNKQSVAELLVNFLRVNPLVGIKNLGKNTISNELHQTINELARIPAFMLDTSLVKLNDIAKGDNTDRSILAPSVISQTKGIWKAVTEGLPSAVKFFKHGGDTATFESSTMFRDRTTGWAIAKPLEVYVKYGFRLQESADIPFKTQAYYRALDEAVKLKMKKSKLPYERAKEELHISDYDRAYDTALYLSFQDNNKVASTYYKWRDGQSPVVRAFSDLMVRYVKTPLNVVSATLDYSGIYPLMKGINNISHEDWKGFKNLITTTLNTPEDRQAISWGIGKGLVGWTLGYIGYSLAIKGLIKSFFEKDDKKERELQGAKGLSYGAIEYNGKSYDISSLTPVSFYLLAGAAYAESEKDKQEKLDKAENEEDKTKAEKISPVTSATSRILKNLALQTPLLSTMIRMYEDNENRDKTGIPDFSSILSPTSLVPAIVGETAKTIDRKERVINNESTTGKIADSVKSMIPVVRESLPSQSDMLGRDIEAPYGFDPLKTKTINKDILSTELTRLDVPLMDSTKGTIAERNEAKREKGQYFAPVLQKVVESDDYKNSGDAIRKQILQDVIHYMSPEYKKDKLTPDEETHNISVIGLRDKFTNNLVSAPQQYSKSRTITDEGMLKNASKIGMKELDTSKMYEELKKYKQEGESEEGIKAFIKSQFTHQLMVGKNTTLAEAQKSIQEFNQDPELFIIKSYLKEKEYNERQPRLKARREDLIKQGKTEEQINAIMAKDRVATAKRNKNNKITSLPVNGISEKRQFAPSDRDINSINDDFIESYGGKINLDKWPEEYEAEFGGKQSVNSEDLKKWKGQRPFSEENIIDLRTGLAKKISDAITNKKVKDLKHIIATEDFSKLTESQRNHLFDMIRQESNSSIVNDLEDDDLYDEVKNALSELLKKLH